MITVVRRVGISNKPDVVLVCMSVSNIPFKLCSHCLQQKPIVEFDKASQNCDGLAGGCKECRKISARAYSRSRHTRRWPCRVLVPDGYKWCRWCQTSKPVTEFSPDKARKDGLYTHCKACHRDYLNKRSDLARQRWSAY